MVDREKPHASHSAGLLAALHRYEQLLQQLVPAGWDTGLYTESSLVFDEMSIHVRPLARLRVCWMEVLISRYELTHALWDTRTHGTPNEVAAMGTKHLLAVERLRQLCTQDVARDD